MDNISTQNEVSDLAGRGIGLAAVLSETKNAGGEVVVKTISGQGTQFCSPCHCNGTARARRIHSQIQAQSSTMSMVTAIS